MNRAQKKMLFCLVIGLISIVAFFAQQYHLSIFLLVALMILIPVVSRHYQKEREKTNKCDELENTILLRASRATMLVFFYLGILVYMTLSHLTDTPKPGGAIRITSDHLNIAFFAACVIGILTHAVAVFVQRFYYRNQRDLYRNAIIRSALLLLFSTVVLSAASTYLALKIAGVFSYNANLFYLLPLFMLGLASGTVRRYPTKLFTCKERAVYKKTRIAGIIVGFVFLGSSSVHKVLDYTELNFATLLIPSLISIWIGIFVHSISSLTTFYFFNPTKKDSTVGGAA
jgi:hypothetical protein